MATRSSCRPTRMIGSRASAFLGRRGDRCQRMTTHSVSEGLFFFPAESKRAGTRRHREVGSAYSLIVAYRRARASVTSRVLFPQRRRRRRSATVSGRRRRARASWYRRLAVLKTRALNRTTPSIRPVSPRSPLSSASLRTDLRLPVEPARSAPGTAAVARLPVSV